MAFDLPEETSKLISWVSLIVGDRVRVEFRVRLKHGADLVIRAEVFQCIWFIEESVKLFWYHAHTSIIANDIG